MGDQMSGVRPDARGSRAGAKGRMQGACQPGGFGGEPAEDRRQRAVFVHKSIAGSYLGSNPRGIRCRSFPPDRCRADHRTGRCGEFLPDRQDRGSRAGASTAEQRPAAHAAARSSPPLPPMKTRSTVGSALLRLTAAALCALAPAPCGLAAAAQPPSVPASADQAARGVEGYEVGVSALEAGDVWVCQVVGGILRP